MGRHGRWEEEDWDVYRQTDNELLFLFVLRVVDGESHLPTVNPAARPIISASRQTTAKAMAMTSRFLLNSCIHTGNPRAAMVFSCLIPVVGVASGAPVRASKPGLSTVILD